MISIIVIAVVGFAYLAWTLRHVWKYQQGKEDSGAKHGSSLSKSQTDLKRSMAEECYRYCVEHLYLRTPNCAAVCGL